MKSDEKTCPYCGEIIKVIAILCKHCRSELPLSLPAARVSIPSADSAPRSFQIAGSEISELLAALVDRSLAVVDQETGRYRMLETVRQYGEDRLLESQDAMEVRNRHFATFLDFAERAAPYLQSRDQLEWLARLDAEHGNLRSALDWNLGQSSDDLSCPAIRIGAALIDYWNLRNLRTEGRALLSALLATDAARTTSPECALINYGAGILAWHQADLDTARFHANRSLEMFKELGDLQGVAKSLNSLGNLQLALEDFDSATSHYLDALAIRRELGDRLGAATSLNNLGDIGMRQDDPLRARGYLEECLSITRDLGERWLMGTALVNLGLVECELGNLELSRSYFRECLEKSIEMGYWGDPDLLEGLAGIAIAENHCELALMLYGAAERSREVGEYPMSESDQKRLAPKIAALKAALNDEAHFNSAWQQGRAMETVQAATLVLG